MKLEQEHNVMQDKRQTMRKKTTKGTEEKKNNGLDVSGNVCMTEFFSTFFTSFYLIVVMALLIFVANVLYFLACEYELMW